MNKSWKLFEPDEHLDIEKVHQRKKKSKNRFDGY